MSKVIQVAAVADEFIISKIYLIRGHKVMIDRDLAELFGVDTRRLKEAVRRNINRFPPDFMFELNANELENWRSQIATSNSGDKKGLRYAPFCFHKDILVKLEKLEKKLLKQDAKMGKHEADIQLIFEMLKELINPPEEPRPRIGFRRKDEID